MDGSNIFRRSEIEPQLLSQKIIPKRKHISEFTYPIDEFIDKMNTMNDDETLIISINPLIKMNRDDIADVIEYYTDLHPW